MTVHFGNQVVRCLTTFTMYNLNVLLYNAKVINTDMQEFSELVTLSVSLI